MPSIQLLKNQPLRAKATFPAKRLGGTGDMEMITVQTGDLWTVLSPEGDWAASAAVEEQATIRISLVEPGFSEHWELA